jgi:hypothetical protein
MSRLHTNSFLPVLAGRFALTALAYAADPAPIAWLPPCLFHRLTGLWCPACGATRAFHQLARGNFMAAFHFNPVEMTIHHG